MIASYLTLSICSIDSNAWMATSMELELSPDKLAGLIKGTLTLFFSTILFILLLSVDTMSLSKFVFSQHLMYS